MIIQKVKRVFKVNGKPFFPLGGQACNSSGWNAIESEQAFKAIKLLHGNTLEIPVYWNVIEPEEGVFNFKSVNDLLANGRRYGIKLIILWFATWKNGNMDYAPAWVKTNPKKYKRVISPSGKPIWVLSSHCQSNLDAEKKAFAALCKHLKAVDGVDQTVIGFQLENEPGIMGSDRDYGPEAQAVFDSAVPAKLVGAMKKLGKGLVYDAWQAAGGKEGTWPEMFGWEGGEFMTAWSIASYINSVAKAGKAVYDRPMYINVWLLGQGWWPIPGEVYPSGGAVTKVLDIYKWFTPDVDMVSPDSHIGETKAFEAVCEAYARDDNPFFQPETGAAENSHGWNMFRSIADYNSLGDFFFACEKIIDEDGSVRPDCQTFVDSVRCAAAVIPLLLKYQGTGKVRSVIQEDLMESRIMEFDGYTGLIEFGPRKPGYNGKDWHHPSKPAAPAIQDYNRGRGMIIQPSKNEFYLVGANYRLYLRPAMSLEEMKRRMQIADQCPKLPGWHIVSVDEGYFNEKEEFVIIRQRNGDEIDPAVWVEPDCGVIRVITCD